MSEPIQKHDRTYEIHEVSALTGLEPARLRAWERRYSAVRPTRLANRYRVYSAEQVALLRAFARLIAEGARIGALVDLSPNVVLERAEATSLEGSPLGPLVTAIRALDRVSLQERVKRLVAELGRGRFSEEIVLPLSQLVGDLWAVGRLTIASEHMATEVVLGALKQQLQLTSGIEPVVLAACLEGEQHEWGVLATLAQLCERGWRAHYLGPDLPLREVIEAAWTVQPACVALTSSAADNLASRLSELRRFRSKLPPGTMMLIGGEGIRPHARHLREAGFRMDVSVLPDPASIRVPVGA